MAMFMKTTLPGHLVMPGARYHSLPTVGRSKKKHPMKLIITKSQHQNHRNDHLIIITLEIKVSK